MKKILTSLVMQICIVATFASGPDRQSVLEVAEKVFDWQQANPTGTQGRGLHRWKYGTCYSGLMDLYKVDPKIKYLSAMTAMGTEYEWSVFPRPYDGIPAGGI